MKTDTETCSALTEKLFHENEINANRLAASLLPLLGAFFITFSFLESKGSLNIVGNLGRLPLFLAGLLNILVLPIGFLVHFDKKWLKQLLLGGVLFSSGIVFFLYPMNATYLTYGLIIISAMYYDRRIILNTAFVSWILYTILLWANVYLDTASQTIHMLHQYQENNIWQYPITIFYGYFIPRTILFLITTFVCYSIAKRGRDLVQKQAEMSAKATSIETDLNAAFDLQLSSLPDADYVAPDGSLTIQAYTRPAKVVGGDFYDYFTVGNDVVFLIADVADKGLSAAMFMMKAKITFQTAVKNHKTLEEAIASANNALFQDNAESLFVTLWIARVNIHTGIGEYINCGHLPPLLRHADGSVTQIESEPDMILGAFEGISPQAHFFRMKPSDMLLLYTDGVTESADPNGAFFGLDHLRDCLRMVSGEEPDLRNYVVDTIDRFMGNADQFDDITVMTVKIPSIDNALHKEFCFVANDTAAEQAIDAINLLLDECSCPKETRQNIDVVFDEICTNIVDYGYPDKPGDIRIQVAICENRVNVVFIDHGIPFNPLEADEPVFSDDPQIGGLGIHLTRNIMDRVEYAHIDDENRLFLTKKW